MLPLMPAILVAPLSCTLDAFGSSTSNDGSSAG
jgi:hypothetical protein